MVYCKKLISGRISLYKEAYISMTTSSNDSLIMRSPTRDDISAITALVNAGEIVDQGQAETVAEDIIEFWVDKHLDLEHDACVLVTAEGEIIAYTAVPSNSDGFALDPHTSVHPTYRGNQLETKLLQFVEERAREIATGNGSIPPLIKAWSFNDETTRLLQQKGYTITSSDWRMRIVMNEVPPPPQQLPGIIVRLYIPGREERAIHQLVQEAFQDIGGMPYRPFEEWEETVLKRTHFDPTMLYVAVDGEQIVGTVSCRSYPEQQSAMIGQVAVHRAWRKRGIARCLLHTIFGECFRRGLYCVELDVAIHNPNGAYNLYQHVGMHRHSQVDYMQKHL
jgi:mycothiol synthase